MNKLSSVFSEIEEGHSRIAAAISKNKGLASMLADKQRHKKFSLEACGLYLDMSKNLLDEPLRSSLYGWARAAKIPEKMALMLSGRKVNSSEGRAALHTALRGSLEERLGRLESSESKSIIKKIDAVRDSFLDFAEKIRSGMIKGSTGKPFTDVLSIGIGGSYLGPCMAAQALAPPCDEAKLRLHFLANIDSHELLERLQKLCLETTLFIISSKTFTTEETMMNARTLRLALVHVLGKQAVAAHFVALSTNKEAVKHFGISRQRCFEFWDFVGGRYSLCSSIGLSLALLIGKKAFLELLAGAGEMDKHVARTALEKNIAVNLALLHSYYRNFCGMQSYAIIPYSSALRSFPAYLQQLEMESNGKSLSGAGQSLQLSDTSPVVWGGLGTNAEHSFFQMLHQGSTVVPVDFIAVARPDLAMMARKVIQTHVTKATKLASADFAKVMEKRFEEHQNRLFAHVCAQSESLACGFSEDQAMAMMLKEGLLAKQAKRLAPHRCFAGNRPSNLLLLPDISPSSLGKLIALYEHKVAVQGFLWDVNSFDQWGVELGKRIAKKTFSILQATKPKKIATKKVTKTASKLNNKLSEGTLQLLHRFSELTKKQKAKK